MSRQPATYRDGGRNHFTVTHPAYTDIVGVDLGGFYSLDGRDLTPDDARAVAAHLLAFAEREDAKQVDWEEITCEARDELVKAGDLTPTDTIESGIRVQRWTDRDGVHVLTDRTWPDPYARCDHVVPA